VKELWYSAVESIRFRVNEEDFATYFGRLRYVGHANDEIQVVIDDPFLAEWVRNHYQGVLEDALESIGGRPVPVSISYRSADNATVDLPATDDFDLPVENLPADRPSVVTAVDNDWDAFPLNPHYRFDSFVVGSGNEMAHAAASAVARDPARAFNPLFIYGGTGLGKTHLLHAIGQTLSNSMTGRQRIMYLSAEEFTNQVIRGISRQEMHLFHQRYRSRCDVLLVDDVHVLAGKERTQEEFFHTFNALHAAQKQIVLTSDRPPQEIQRLEERLRSRFQWGLITDIKAPQFETRVAILQRFAERDGIELPDDVAFFLAGIVRSNVRELEGALIRLSAFASFRNQRMTVEFAQQALQDVVATRARALTIESIQKLVAEHYDLKVSDLRSKRRHRVVSHPRGIAMFLCRKHTQASFPQIARGFDKKDHTTIIAACRKVTKALEADLATRAEVEAIERKFHG